MTSSDIVWPRHTERLTLRPATAPDIARMLTYRNDPEVIRWLIKTTVDPEVFTQKWLEAADDPYDHSCVAFAGDVQVGSGMLEVIDGMAQGDAPEGTRVEGMLGYILDPAHAGHGYATEMSRNLLSLAFDDLGLRRVTAGCFADNHASRRILEKLGMRLEQYGVQDSWHAEVGWIDGCTYAILREEWLALREGQ
ncbi:GNAT family N-acetyltransferase [Knoellia subterranea]|uniref:GCN5 family acetyltransferase n=1 Tax=Knoellia subterranea KCTC 19937 TaxID=1385521 RepID=A0A0A0JEE6_9MICO|nr:GNAT family protein [Knoellia subterranea]KGN35488.1 GCN5 family acetyltransferase [Knoellia subterranea KCTC 19937]